MFNAASKLYFALAGFAIVLGFGYVVATSDRVGFTALVMAGFGAVGLALAAFAFVPREPIMAGLDEAAEARPADATDTAGASPWPLVAAAAVGLTAAGAATRPQFILFGIVLGVIAAFAWFGQVWREHPSWTPAMSDRLNDRFIVPIGLPGTIFALAGIGVISLSRLLLAVSDKAAPFIVITLAAGVLAAFYLLSTRHVGGQALAALAAVSAGLVVAAGVAGALKGERKFESEGSKSAFSLTAKDVSFVDKELKLPASTAIELVFDNQDPTQHNVDILDKEGGSSLFRGPVVNKGKTTYKFTSPKAGSYYFQCDVHPSLMHGTVVVGTEASTSPQPGSNATTSSTIGS